MIIKHIVASSDIDRRTVDGFGEESVAFDQMALEGEESEAWFDASLGIPLSAYRHGSFSMMRTGACDRFGTKSEQLCKGQHIEPMMLKGELEHIRLSDRHFCVASSARAPS